MLDTISRYLAGVSDAQTARALRYTTRPIADRLSSQAITSAGLVIKAGTSTLAKTGASDFYATVQGKLVTIAAGTDMPALTGISITATKYNVVCFFIDSASTVTVAAGTQGATIAAVAWPPFPEGKALVGVLLITHSSTFTGGTTALDTATTVYISLTGPFDPSILL
jgi:hypothetical protein